MHQGKHIFSQITEFIPRREFDMFVKQYKGNQRIRSLDCRDQLLAMMFGQLTNLRSLRGIVLCLNAHAKLLYHLGFKTNKLVLSTLARANENRNWKIYLDLTQLLIKKARKLYINDNDFNIELNGSVYALDSTVIELCLSTFRWAYFELEKSAIKIHTQLDLRGNIPAFFVISEAKVHDVNFMDILEFEFELDVKKIADLYKNRWRIELFFKWIKQHLRIEVFWGCSANAVKTQICTAMCAFLIVAIMKKQLKIDRNLYEILQILSVSQFEKTPINTMLHETELQNFNERSPRQACLFDF